MAPGDPKPLATGRGVTSWPPHDLIARGPVPGDVTGLPPRHDRRGAGMGTSRPG